jgi:hypothetical protein
MTPVRQTPLEVLAGPIAGAARMWNHKPSTRLNPGCSTGVKRGMSTAMRPTTSERALRRTPASLNRAIRNGIGECVREHAALPARFAGVDREGGSERPRQTNAATLAPAGVVLGAAAHKRGHLVSCFGDRLSVPARRAGMVPGPAHAAQTWFSHHARDRVKPKALWEAFGLFPGRIETAAPAMPCHQRGFEG